MYNPEQKQIVLKNSFGVSYHVYYESGRGLCLRMLGESRVWSRGYILSDLAVNDFSVLLDQDDIFHFVFQTKDGRILYGHGRHGQMEIQPILSSRDTTPWPKYVSLLITEDRILFFYIIRYKDRHLVSMQTIHNGNLSKPMAIDYVEGPDIHYLAFLDRSNLCHLLYTNSDSTKTRLIHRVLKEDYRLFSAPEKIYETPHDILFPSAVCPDNKRIHFIFQVHTADSYQILYKTLAVNTDTQTLYKSTTPPGYTGLVFSHQNLYFFRITTQRIYYRSSPNLGESWTDETLYAFGNGGALTCFVYHTNLKSERNEIFSHELPGNFSGGYQLAFLHEKHTQVKEPQEPYSRSPVNRISQTGGVSVNRSASLSEKEENKERVVSRDVQKKVMLLQNLTENMQRELTKLWITQKEYEKKLDKLNDSYQELQRDVVQFLSRQSITCSEEKFPLKEEDFSVMEVDGIEELNMENGEEESMH